MLCFWQPWIESKFHSAVPATYDVLEELGFGKYQLQMIAIIGTIIVSDSAQVRTLAPDWLLEVR